MSKDAIIIAGPNGSGKTTFAEEFLTVYDYEFVNADDIASKLADEQLEKVRIQAGRLFFQKVSELIEVGESLIVETTLSGRSFQRIIDQLKNAEYTVTVVFIFLQSPEVCIARVKQC